VGEVQKHLVKETDLRIYKGMSQNIRTVLTKIKITRNCMILRHRPPAFQHTWPSFCQAFVRLQRKMFPALRWRYISNTSTVHDLTGITMTNSWVVCHFINRHPPVIENYRTEMLNVRSATDVTQRNDWCVSNICSIILEHFSSLFHGLLWQNTVTIKYT
jgi:hypothetical protein